MNTVVVAFPLQRQQKLVSGIAHVLRSKQGDDATLFWRETAKGLLHQLTQSGVALQSAEDQVRSLLYAVIAEMEADTIAARG